MAENFTGGRRRPPLPTANGNASGSPAAPSSSSSSVTAAAVNTQLKANAPEFVPGKKAATTATPGPSSGALNAHASAFQPKFLQSSAVAAAIEPSKDAVKAATAAISPDVAATKAAASKMSAGAQAFTPTRSNDGSFPATPNKDNSNNNSSSGGVKIASPGVTPSAPANAKAPPPPPPSLPPQTRLPDPFKNSVITVPAQPAAKPAQSTALNTAWTLYADSKQAAGPMLGGAAAAAAAQTQQNESFDPVRLAQISDVESFWRLLRSVPTPASRQPRFTYYFFRRTIYPSWEEPRNQHGGTFSVLLWDSRTGSDTSRELVNDVWTLVLAGLAGESLDESLIINGVCVKIRNRMITLEMWTNTCAKPRVQKFVASLRELLKKRVATFPQDRFDRLEFLSNETNRARSTPSSPPAAAGGGSKATKHALSSPVVAAPQAVSNGASDFTI